MPNHAAPADEDDQPERYPSTHAPAVSVPPSRLLKAIASAMSKLIVEMAAVRLTVVRDDMEAEALCGLLRTNGIACFHRKSDVAGAIFAESGGFTIAGPTEVLVNKLDVDAA